MSNADDQAMVDNAKSYLEDKAQVWITVAGLTEAVQIRDIYVAADTNLLVAVPENGEPDDRLIIRPGALTVVKATNSSKATDRWLNDMIGQQ